MYEDAKGRILLSILRYAGQVSGRVQGVGFRYFVQQRAQRLGITGWVQNQPDGTVKMEIQGPPDKLAVLQTALRAGRALIRVETLELTEQLPLAGERGFSIRK